jgi:hypothetical protein
MGYPIILFATGMSSLWDEKAQDLHLKGIAKTNKLLLCQ